MIKNPPANAGDTEDVSSIPGSRQSPGGENGNPLQYSCLENSMDRGAWQATASVSSVAQSCPTLCNPMDCSTPGFPVHHQLPEFIRTHVLCIGDAIQPSHPLPSTSPPAFDLSQHQGWESVSKESVLHIGWPNYWSFSFSISPSNEYSGLISFMTVWLDLLAV